MLRPVASVITVSSLDICYSCLFPVQNSSYVFLRLETDAPCDSASQPVVLMLVWDCNLSLEKAEEATQPMQPEDPDRRTVWQVQGANAKSFDLPFGYSHRDPGIRKDIHDAIGVDLRVIWSDPSST